MQHKQVEAPNIFPIFLLTQDKVAKKYWDNVSNVWYLFPEFVYSGYFLGFLHSKLKIPTFTATTSLRSILTIFRLDYGI